MTQTLINRTVTDANRVQYNCYAHTGIANYCSANTSLPNAAIKTVIYQDVLLYGTSDNRKGEEGKEKEWQMKNHPF